MTAPKHIKFKDNPAAQAKPKAFITIEVSISFVLKSWKSSLYSFEWLNPNGTIKSLKELSDTEAAKRQTIEDAINKGESIEKPILGIGMMDNIEIGSGRAQLLTLAAHGLESLPVHIPTNNEKDFKAFLANKN